MIVLNKKHQIKLTDIISQEVSAHTDTRPEETILFHSKDDADKYLYNLGVFKARDKFIPGTVFVKGEILSEYKLGESYTYNELAFISDRIRIDDVITYTMSELEVK